jgi:hypothetical protein
VVTMRECCTLRCDSQCALVRAVGKIGQRNPVERVGEKRGHASLLGQP